MSPRIDKSVSIIEPLPVTSAVIAEYEKQSGLIGICAILERRGLIKIIPDEQVVG